MADNWATVPLSKTQRKKRAENKKFHDPSRIKSFSDTIVAVEKGIGRAPLREEQYEKLMKQVKKCRRRIDKWKKLIRGPETEGNSLLYAETRTKILKEEEILSRSVMLMKQREGEKEKIDQREKTKFERKQLIEGNQVVKLEKGQVVPAHNPTQAHHRLNIRAKELQAVKETGSDKHTIYKPHPKSTEKNPHYVETSHSEIRKGFFNKINKKEPVPRRKVIVEKKELLRVYGSSKTIITQHGIERPKRNYVEPLDISPKT